MPHDLSLHSGERQTARSYDDIRADHRYRYEWAAKFIPERTFGLDAFCGNGYGAWLLGETRQVLALDGSAEAITFANEHFRRGGALFSHAYWPFQLPIEAFDFIVSLESIEHVADGQAFFDALCASLKPGGVFVFSTPNEELLPHRSTGNHFHFRHYTLAETDDLARAAGLSIIGWAGQNTYEMLENGNQGPLLSDKEMILRDSVAGQFSIFACRKPMQAPRRGVLASLFAR